MRASLGMPSAGGGGRRIELAEVVDASAARVARGVKQQEERAQNATPMHWLTNRFTMHPDVEAGFQADRLDVQLWRVRTTSYLLFCGIVVYALGSLPLVLGTDDDEIRGAETNSLIIRLVGALPSVAIFHVVSRSPRLAPMWKWISTACVVAPIVCIMAANGQRIAKFMDLFDDDLEALKAPGEGCLASDGVTPFWAAAPDPAPRYEFTDEPATNEDFLHNSLDYYAAKNTLLVNRLWPTIMLIAGMVLRLDFVHCAVLWFAGIIAWLGVVSAVAEVSDSYKTALLVIVTNLGLLATCHLSDRTARSNFLLKRATQTENSFLREELVRMRAATARGIDMNSPVETVLSALQRVVAADELDAAARTQLTDAIELLSNAEDLSAPDIGSQLRDGVTQIDKDVGAWLANEVLAQPAAGAAPAPAAASGSAAAGATRARPTSADDSMALAGVVAEHLPALGDVSDWDLDVIALSEQTGGRPLLVIAWAIFHKHALLRELNIAGRTLTAFCSAVEAGYEPNPYHNHEHAADVLNSTYHILEIMSLAPCALDRLRFFAAMVAAGIHDFKHPGRTNAFMIKSKTPLAILYSDSSVLERMHLAQAFQLRNAPETDIFASLDKDEYATVRATIIELVLATDLSLHFEILGQLKAKLAANEQPLKPDDPSEKQAAFARKVAIKLSDLGHSAKCRALHLRWTDRIVEEFFIQGDEERRLGSPISAFMDRTKPDTPKNQRGFFEFIVMPLYHAAGDAANVLEPLVAAAEANHAYWTEELHRAQL